MSLFSKLFPRTSADLATGGYLKTLTGYQPVFHTYGGGIYESELCRASINAIATHAAKLKPIVQGKRKDLQYLLEFEPNPWMDTYKFLYKVATILECENTAFIVPMFDQYYQKIVGFYPVLPSSAEIRESGGTEYLVFKFASGQKAAIERDLVGIMTKFFYKSEFFGESNAVLGDTLNMITMQRQGITEGIKQSATVRFLARLGTAMKPADIDAERKRWVTSTLGSDNNGGLALFDSKYVDAKQIDSRPYIVNASQMELIQKNVFDYFGVSEPILQNDFTPDQWASFYEGKIEPFAIQLSMVLTNMVYSANEKKRDNRIMLTANRLQYAAPDQKLAVVKDLSDRGMMSRNEGREVFNMEPIDGGDEFFIRGEYKNAKDAEQEVGEDAD